MMGGRWRIRKSLTSTKSPALEKCPEAKNPSARGSLLLLPIADLLSWFTEHIVL